MQIFKYAAGIFFLTYAIFWVGDTRDLDWWSSPWHYQRTPDTMPTIQGSGGPKIISENSTFDNYRNGIARTGNYAVTISPNLTSMFVSTVHNVGIHGASKSTVMPIGEDFIVPTDSSHLARVTKEGKVIWRYRAPVSNRGFHSTPSVNNDVVLFGDYSGFFGSLNAQTGELIWGLPVGETVGASPVVTPDKKILVSIETLRPDGYLAKLDAATGKVEWLSDFLTEQSHSSPAMYWNSVRPQDSIVMIGDNRSQFSAFRYGDGSLIWRVQLGGPVKSTPALHLDRAYVSSWDGYLYSFNIHDGAIAWKKKLENFNQSSVAILPQQNLGFINSRKGICRFDLLNEGTELVCTDQPSGPGPRKGSPIITRSPDGGNYVWAPCETNSVCLYSVDLKLIKKWDSRDGISGELRPFQNGLIGLTDGEAGIVFLRPTGK